MGKQNLTTIKLIGAMTTRYIKRIEELTDDEQIIKVIKEYYEDMALAGLEIPRDED